MSTQKPNLNRVWAALAPSANVVDPDTIQPGKFSAGWSAEVPPFEYFNYIQKLFSQGLVHINEQGVPVWDSETVYPVRALAKGPDGKIYECTEESSNSNPTLKLKWKEFIFDDLSDPQSSILIGGESISKIANASKRVNILDYVTSVSLALSGAENIQPAIAAATADILSGDYPGGTIYFPRPDNFYNLGTQGTDFWQILLDQQGMVDGDLHLPSGQLVRGTLLRLECDSYVEMRTAKGAAFTTPYLFKWGRFLGSPTNAGMTAQVVGNFYIEGPGVIGHTTTTYIAGAAGYTSTTNPNLGTTDTSTCCFLADLVSPPSYIDGARVRYFNSAAEAVFGFGLEWRSGSIQWCNIGTFPRDGFTNFHHGDALEIELCAIGSWARTVSSTTFNNTVVEANQIDLLLQNVNHYVFNMGWFEGAPDKSVFMRGVPGSAMLANQSVFFNNVLGLNVDSVGSVNNVHLNRCQLNDKGERWVANVGDTFKDVVYDHCTISGEPFDWSVVTVDGTISKQDITVLGDTVGKLPNNFGGREIATLRRSISAATASTPVTCFSLIIPNVYTASTIEISGFKIGETNAQDTRPQEFKYRGLISRFGNQNTVIEWDTATSFVKNYSNGTNLMNLVATPEVIIVSGGSIDTQTVEIRFATGTAVAGSAETMFEAKLLQMNDGIEFA